MAFEIEQPIDAGPSPVVEATKPRLLGVLGLLPYHGGIR
jgi:hypothetical protein